MSNLSSMPLWWQFISKFWPGDFLLSGDDLNTSLRLKICCVRTGDSGLSMRYHSPNRLLFLVLVVDATNQSARGRDLWDKDKTESLRSNGVFSATAETAATH